MEPTEKELIINKVMEMPMEQAAKVLIFIAGLEAGGMILVEKSTDYSKE